MCDPITLAVISGGGLVAGTGLSYLGEKQGAEATKDALKQSERNQERLRQDNVTAGLEAAAASNPAAVDAGVQPVAQDSTDLAQALAASTPGAGDPRFAADLGRTATASARSIDAGARQDDLRRLFGLSQQQADRAIETAGLRIGANNDEARLAMAYLPRQLQAAGAQGRGYRLAGSILQQLGRTGMTAGIGGMSPSAGLGAMTTRTA